MKQSERTCCICRATADKRSLARLICLDGKLVWDIRQSLPGRGGYVHQEAKCVSKMGQPARWERVLKVPPGTLKAVNVEEVARGLFVETCVGSLGAIEVEKSKVSEVPKKGGAAGKVRL